MAESGGESGGGGGGMRRRRMKMKEKEGVLPWVRGVKMEVGRLLERNGFRDLRYNNVSV